MKKIFIFAVLMICVCFSKAWADQIFTAKVTTVDKHVFTFNTEGKAYQFTTLFKSQESKDAIAAAGMKKEVIIVAEPDKVFGTDKPLFAPTGATILKLRAVILPGKGGVETGTFIAMECGDSCYFDFKNAKGKEQTFFAGSFANSKLFEDKPSMKGTKIRIVWQKVKKDNVLCFAEPIK